MVKRPETTDELWPDEDWYPEGEWMEWAASCGISPDDID